MKQDEEKRLRHLALSGVVGSDIRSAVRYIDTLRALLRQIGYGTPMESLGGSRDDDGLADRLRMHGGELRPDSARRWLRSIDRHVGEEKGEAEREIGWGHD